MFLYFILINLLKFHLYHLKINTEKKSIKVNIFRFKLNYQITKAESTDIIGNNFYNLRVLHAFFVPTVTHI
jgi:hypothetical protein